jgi:hypothetical protein
MNEVTRPLGKFRPNPKLKLREQLAEVNIEHRTSNVQAEIRKQKTET